MAGTILQQTFVVEYVVNHQMCDDCRRVEAKDTWNASVSYNLKIYISYKQTISALIISVSGALPSAHEKH